MFLVGVDVLGDPLRQKFDTQKAKRYPDRFLKSVGVDVIFGYQRNKEQVYEGNTI